MRRAPRRPITAAKVHEKGDGRPDKEETGTRQQHGAGCRAVGKLRALARIAESGFLALAVFPLDWRSDRTLPIR